MTCGASLLAFAVLWILRSRLPASTVDAFSVYSLSFLVNGSHFSATNYRLYHSLDNIRQYPATALVVPFAVLAATAASAIHSGGAAPYFAKIYLLWSPYHFSAQTLGITLLYARRSGLRFSIWERRALSWFLFGCFITSAARLESTIGWMPFMGLRIPSLGLPAWTAAATHAWVVACAAFYAAALARRRAKGEKIQPLLILLPATQYVWFVLGVKLYSFYQLVPFFHSLQYMLIAWFMQMKEIHAKPAGYPLETARWVGTNLIGHALLFAGFPLVLGQVFGVAQNLALPLAFVAVQVHHFFVDGVIWKLRDPAVGGRLTASVRTA